MADAIPQLSKPPCHRGDAIAVVRRLRDAGHVAYFAGGCVRDVLLGSEPKDYDVATDATPDRVRKLFSNTQAVGAAFGVVLVRHGASVVEVATFRSDGRYDDGRRPISVAFTDPEHDAQRRDFTINGLFLDPLSNQVIDYVGGRADLQAKLIRAIGDADLRFAEDHLRLLRAVRFAARLGFAIEPTTAAAIRQHATHLKRISPERTGEELRLMLTAPTRHAAWDMLWRLDLTPVIFRFLPPRTQPRRAETDVFLATDAPTISFGLALASGSLTYLMSDPETDLDDVLADDAVSMIARAMRQALRISNDELDMLTGVLTGIRPLLAGTPPTVATIKRFLAKPTMPDAMRLLAALQRIGARSARIVELQRQIGIHAQADCNPPPLITGDDLLAAGMKPGPVFKRVLDAVYDAQLECRVSDKASALALAVSLGGPR